MRLIYRPVSGKIVGGVAAGVAERYGLNVLMLRIFFLALLNTSELAIFIYILLWLSIPGEDAVVSRLRLASDESIAGRRFDDFSGLAMRTLGFNSSQTGGSIRILSGILLILIAIFLQGSRGFGFSMSFGPIAHTVYSVSARLGIVFVYICIALLFLIRPRILANSLILTTQLRDVFRCDDGETRALFGVVSGYGTLTGIEPAFLRAFLVLANFLTFGFASLLYLLTGLIAKKHSTAADGAEDWHKDLNQRTFGVGNVHHLSPVTSIGAGLLFLALALIRLFTEYRLFFFNEPFAAGCVLVLIALLLVYDGIRSGTESSRAELWLLSGSAIFLYGIYQLAIALFNVQLTVTARYQLFFVLAGLTFLYAALVLFSKNARCATLMISSLLFLPALIAQVKPTSINFVLSITRFYEFFYPILFAACGLWLLVERRRLCITLPAPEITRG